MVDQQDLEAGLKQETVELTEERLRPSRPLIPEKKFFSDMLEYGCSRWDEMEYFATSMVGRTMQAGSLVYIVVSSDPKEVAFKGIMTFAAGTLIRSVNKLAQYAQATYERRDLDD